MYGRPHNIYIVNLIAFNLLVNNKLITQFIIAFTFVNMSKIVRGANSASESVELFKVLHL